MRILELGMFKLYAILYTVWKVSKYGVISGPYFPVFELNMDQNCLSVFDHFVGLAPKGLNTFEALP